LPTGGQSRPAVRAGPVRWCGPVPLGGAGRSCPAVRVGPVRWCGPVALGGAGRSCPAVRAGPARRCGPACPHARRDVDKPPAQRLSGRFCRGPPIDWTGVSPQGRVGPGLSGVTSSIMFFVGPTR